MTESTESFVLPPAADPAALLALLRAPRAGIVTDIDGTIAPFALTPASATVDLRARAALARLTLRLALVAALTGRRAMDGATLIGIPEMLVVGNHGMETLSGTTLSAEPSVAPYVVPVQRMLARLREFDLPAGTLIEEKGPTASVHYRLATDWVAARNQLFALMTPLAVAENLLLTEGRAIIEVRPPVPVNKGRALRSLREEYALDTLIMLGDDLTDVDAFHALHEMREAGTVRGAAIGVLVAGGETPPEILQAADAIVTGVSGTADLLTAFADGLESVADERQPRFSPAPE